ncbi:MAG: PKD domain-containing protein, partial [Methanobacteriota archaeon]
GQPNGATPAWIILKSGGKEIARLHHTFNVKHPDTWIWRVDDLSSYFPERECTFTAYISDLGSDDLNITWNWGDGTTTEHFYYNDGVGPDPYPSPDVNPIVVTDTATHSYASAGTYTVTLTVRDDDGGVVTETMVLDLS